MADSCFYSIQIGGPISDDDAEELHGLLEVGFYDINDDPNPIDLLNSPKPDSLFWSGFSSSTPDDVTIFCQRHRLTYRLCWEGGYEWGPGCEFWEFGMEHPRTIETNHDHVPVLTVHEIHDLRQKGKFEEKLMHLHYAGVETIQPLVRA